MTITIHELIIGLGRVLSGTAICFVLRIKSMLGVGIRMIMAGVFSKHQILWNGIAFCITCWLNVGSKVSTSNCYSIVHVLVVLLLAQQAWSLSGKNELDCASWTESDFLKRYSSVGWYFCIVWFKIGYLCMLSQHVPYVSRECISSEENTLMVLKATSSQCAIWSRFGLGLSTNKFRVFFVPWPRLLCTWFCKDKIKKLNGTRNLCSLLVDRVKLLTLNVLIN